MGLISGWETKILQAMWYGKKTQTDVITLLGKIPKIYVHEDTEVFGFSHY